MIRNLLREPAILTVLGVIALFLSGVIAGLIVKAV